MEGEQWAKVELMGHRTRVGKVSEVEMFGGKLMRIAALDDDGVEQPIEFYGASAMFCLTLTTEEAVMMAVAEHKRLREEIDQRHREWLNRRALAEAKDEPADDDPEPPF